MVEGIQLKVTMARRQPSFDLNNDQSTKSWSSIGTAFQLHDYLLTMHIPEDETILGHSMKFGNFVKNVPILMVHTFLSN